ncbi:MAG: phosphatase PAP2 family protein [Opitutae bacterium]
MKQIAHLLAGLWLVTSLHAAPAPHFFAADTISLQNLLPAPPAADSLVAQAEREVLYHLQAERTPAQVARAQRVNAEDIFSFGSDVLGPWFEAKRLPQTTAFFAQVNDDLTPYNRAAKALFNRRRPPYADARLKPCIEFSDTGSYPSGHALRAALWAGLLGAIFPEMAAACQVRADETRWARLLAGVHYPSDVEAGRILGDALAREMLKQPDVQKALEEIRAETSPFSLKKAG